MEAARPDSSVRTTADRLKDDLSKEVKKDLVTLMKSNKVDRYVPSLCFLNVQPVVVVGQSLSQACTELSKLPRLPPCISGRV